MKPIIIVHGIGGGDTATKSGYSHALRKIVLSGYATDDCLRYWKEVAWEGVNDQIDANIKDIVIELLSDNKKVQRSDFQNSTWGAMRFSIAWSMRFIKNSARKTIPTVLDYLLDLPLYIGDPRGSAIRRIVGDVIIANPNAILVGHSLGSLICYDILCEAKNTGVDLCVDALVTFGSPIGWAKGMDENLVTVKSASLDIPWVNMYYANDPVCLSKPLDETRFGGVENISLAKPNVVSIAAHTAYWKDNAVAQKIRELALS